VNIPSASVEAVDGLRVVQRHAAIVGKADHPSPQLTAQIRGITLNQTWTIPRSIVEKAASQAEERPGLSPPR